MRIIENSDHGECWEGSSDVIPTEELYDEWRDLFGSEFEASRSLDFVTLSVTTLGMAIKGALKKNRGKVGNEFVHMERKKNTFLAL